MSQVGHNIKKLRKVKSLSQQAFAEIFNLTRGNISSYEELRAEPKIDVTTQIANYFSIPLEDFLHKNLSVNEILNFNDYFDPKNQPKNFSFKNIPFLSKDHFLEMEKYADNLNSLPVLTFPIFSPKEFLAIELHHLIDHHTEFSFQEGSIAFFKKLHIGSLHLIDKQFGLVYQGETLFIGEYNIEDKKISLVLNDWQKMEVNVDALDYFWRFDGIFQQVLD